MRWVREYGKTPPRLWLEGIDTLNDAQCRYALNELRRKAVRFPPSLGEFCLYAGINPDRTYLGPEYDPSKILPRGAASREHVDGILAKMRRRLGVPIDGPPPCDEIELEARDFEVELPIGGEPLACTCPPDTPTPDCPACQEWDRRMRESAP